MTFARPAPELGVLRLEGSMSEAPLVKTGHKVFNEDGSLLCTAARDIFRGEIIMPDQFVWGGERPEPFTAVPKPVDDLFEQVSGVGRDS